MTATQDLEIRVLPSFSSSICQKTVSKSNTEFMLLYGEFCTQASVGGFFVKSHICVKDDLVPVGFTVVPIDLLSSVACSVPHRMGIAQSRKLC